MYNEIIKLISETETIDTYGDLVRTEASKTIFAKLGSVGGNEYYNAQATGLKPELKFIIADYLDYDGQLLLRYTPFQGSETEYTIIRTYRDGNALELTCQKVGD